MANVTANEQLMLELINHARLDPEGEAQRLGINLNQGLTAGTISATAKQPLAFNDLLINAARNHAVWQIDQDIFSHTGAAGSSPGDRMTAAGYLFAGFQGWGENLSWRGQIPGPIDAAGVVPLDHDGLFLSSGHRQNMLTGDFREIGIGQGIGDFTKDGEEWSASVITLDFAVSGPRVFLTGVIYQDANGDGSYGLNEGLGQRQVNAVQGGTQGNTQTNAHGGYESIVAPGANRISFLGANPVAVEVQVTSQNIKLDLVGTTVKSSASLTLISGTTTAELLGVAPNGITGSAAAERLVGNRGANRLLGNGGNDTLDGGAGADTLEGGSGNDTYLVDDPNDLVTELAGAGADTVQANRSYTLTGNVEHLLLTGTGSSDGTGNETHNRLTGNAAANRLTGLGGNDTLDGGAGADTLVGGAGNDTYIIDHAADQVTELPSEGVDTARAAITYTLVANLEHLVLTGAGVTQGTGNDQHNHLTGNASGNMLRGLAGNDTLDGGEGADTLIGGTEDDTYVVDQIGDQVTEAVGEGTDTVLAAVNHTLDAHVERLTLSTGALNGTGNDLHNTLAGNGAANLLTGLGGDDTLDGGAGVDTLVGGAGDDVYAVDHPDDQVNESPGEGSDRVESAVSYTLGNQVEDLVLAGSALRGTGNGLANRLTGNASGNALYGEGGNDTQDGGAGNDTLDGGTGVDTLEGGAGDDFYVVDQSGDRVIETAAGGIDSVQSSASFTLPDQVEHLTLTGIAAVNGVGNALANRLTGNGAVNRLSGGEGDDTLAGGAGNDRLIGHAGNDSLNGGAGVDTLEGGTGDDSYVVDDGADLVTELANAGNDTVRASVTWTLSTQTERLILTGSSPIHGTGNGLANTMAGNSAANRLDGAAGNDSLNGSGGDDTLIGGTGDDTLNGALGAVLMEGGTGNDTYLIDSPGDQVSEQPAGGIDTVRTDISHTLADQVEHLVLTGTAANDGTGNALANTLSGNAAPNRLDGGAGNDSLRGAGGDDELYGGTGHDTLDGGTGGDLMEGGTGNDTYLVDSLGDLITEVPGAGSDRVQASIDQILGANLEHLILTGHAAISGIGNELRNQLTGNGAVNHLQGLDGNDQLLGGGGNDTLEGGNGADTLAGGAGNDRLTGGAGVDRFKFLVVREGADTLTDFTSGSDKIQVVSANFGMLPVGALDPARLLTAGALPATGDAVFLYNGTTGALAFDTDGNGNGAAVKIATLIGTKTLVANDIQVVTA